MTEDKIKEAYQNWLDQGNSNYYFEYAQDAFKAGYLACLNSLEPVSLPREDVETLYRLPEGVNRDAD